MSLMRFDTKIQFETDLIDDEKEYVTLSIITRMKEHFNSHESPREHFEQNMGSVVQVATKFDLDGRSVCLFVTCHKIGENEVVMIGVETPDLSTARYLQDEFHESMREFAEEGSEFCSTWVNPELN